ncbi:tyrosine phosphatase-like protein [Cladochytrium replicatum]|nr:tyrosine phosphatase-like protein [Cladochytrium replicatum]
MAGKSVDKNGPSAVIKAYLIAYNAASIVGWANAQWLLVDSLSNTGGDFSKSYEASGWLVTVVQTCAILEVLHSALGFVRSPIMTTLMQIFSRLLLVWGVLHIYDDQSIRGHPAYTTMVIAWTITEMVRYSYYGLNLVGEVPSILLWCRYNFFWVLYPLGAGSEWILLMKARHGAYQLGGSILYWLYVIQGVVYFPGFYILYTHMIKQRQSYVSKPSAAKSKSA